MPASLTDLANNNDTKTNIYGIHFSSFVIYLSRDWAFLLKFNPVHVTGLFLFLLIYQKIRGETGLLWFFQIGIEEASGIKGFNQILNLTISVTNAPSNFLPIYNQCFLVLYITVLPILESNENWEEICSFADLYRSSCVFLLKRYFLLKKWKNSVE